MWDFWVRKRNRRKRQDYGPCGDCGPLMRDLLKVDDLKAIKMKTKKEEAKGFWES